jgi:Uma2 family endonuclease
MAATAFAATLTPTPTEVEIGLSLEDFIQRYDEAPFELIDGEFYEMSPQAIGSSQLGFSLARLMAEVAEVNHLGLVVPEAPFVLKKGKNWVRGSRVPDIMFVTADRLKALVESDPDWYKKPLTIVPDLVVEIMSPTDRFSNVLRKVKLYLSDGVQVCWIVDAERQAVLIYRAGSDQVTLLTEEDTLTEATLLPGLSIPIAKLFP